MVLTKEMKESIAQSKKEVELLKQTEMEKGALLAELQEAVLARKSTQSEKETYLAELNKTREENKELKAQVKLTSRYNIDEGLSVKKTHEIKLLRLISGRIDIMHDLLPSIRSSVFQSTS